MKNSPHILTKIDKRMLGFIFSFILPTLGAFIAISMVVWVLLTRLGSANFTLMTLLTLLVSAVLSHRYSHLLDRHSRSTAVAITTFVILAVLVGILLTDLTLMYALLFILLQCYYSVFYTARSSLAQALIIEKNHLDAAAHTLSFRQLNAVLEVTDKIGMIAAAALISIAFALYGLTTMLIISALMLAVSVGLLVRFSEPQTRKPQPSQTQADKATATQSKHAEQNLNEQNLNEQSSNKPNPQPVRQNKGFAWYFSHPIAWLVTLAMFVNLLVMLSNTIDEIFLYEVLKVTPDQLAYVSITFNVGSLMGALLINAMSSERQAIYTCFTASVVLAWAMAIYPVFMMFLLGSAVLGFINSANRVMFGSVIMQHIDNSEVASFYGIYKSLLQSLQFLGLAMMSIMLYLYPKYGGDSRIVIWFYPAVFALVPLTWIFKNWLLARKAK